MTSAKHLFDAGVVQVKRGDLEAALSLFKESLRQCPGRDSIVQNVAACYFALHKERDLLAEIHQWRALGYDSPTIELLELRAKATLSPERTYSSTFYKYCEKKYHNHPSFVSLDALLAKRFGNYEKAKNQYSTLKVYPGLNDEDLFNYSVFNLLAGHVEEGIKYYEYRPSVRVNKFQKIDQDFVKASTKTLNFFAEQGVGDQMLFFSLIPIVLKNSDLYFNFHLDSRLISLFKGFGSDEYDNRVRFISAEESIQDRSTGRFGLCSLGYVLESIAPGALASELVSRYESVKVGFSKIRKPKKSGRPRIGVTWRSSSLSTGTHKSASIEDFFSGLVDKNVDIVNLQHDASNAELEFLHSKFPNRFDSCENYDKANNFVKLAESIVGVDAVLGVSNSLIHLAGYTNTPTVVLVPRVGQGRHWYWHLPESQLSWYRNVHVVERSSEEKWGDAIENSLNILNMRDCL